MKVASIVICCLGAMPSSAVAQIESPSARDIVVWRGSDDHDLSYSAISAVVAVAVAAPSSPRADSVALGLMGYVQTSSGTVLARGKMLTSLTTLARHGNVVATEALFFFAAVLEPRLRAHAIQLLNFLPDRARVMEAWRSAATDVNEKVASKAVEILAYSGPLGIAELQALIDLGEFRNSAARAWAQDLIQGITRRPR